MPRDSPELRSLPDKILGPIINNLQRFPNETVDFRTPHLRQSLVNIYPLFLVLYGTLVIMGTVGNVAMIVHILRRRLYRDPTCAFIMNVGVCNFIMSVFLLPLSLAILLIQNWIFGSFLCYFVPMLQDVPIHATITTLVFLALDRYLLMVHPPKTRVPPFIAVLGIWVLSVCIVLPYAVYMNYIDLQVIFGKQFEGVGICTVNLGDDIAEYIRGLFVIMYVFPLALAAFFHIRISSEIKSQEPPVHISAMDSRDPESQQDIYTLQDNGRASRTVSQDNDGSSRSTMYQDNSAILSEVDGREEYLLHDTNQLPSFLTPSSTRTTGGTETPVGHQIEGSQIDLTKEKRNQKYIVTMTAAVALCLCPLMILRLVKNMVLETYDNSGHFDITFITFVWVAFFPTVSTPALFASWRMSRSTKDRLEGYLRFSNRSHRSTSSHGGQQHFPANLHSYHRADYRMSLERTQGAPVSYSPVASHDPGGRQDLITTNLTGASFVDQ
ncbi:neuropeptide Y receptor type 5-like [Macrobrachium nipponense]|uniref:neuropeptide Y receptor type 5-like n=1 Tax=Macrobrachium nipponense TaxID=159736 RepID=UPI0030C7E8DC